ncbi:30S ribosomal protein S12 methylthiotransferase RimO [Chlamydiifrater phoenicopteri]|uniref:30S ribosomal protein S12 methylthiotransferase RimO n=1 Tax=Chlamydiifrater phoenicopteri TaxID=2681469 RepID=UPI001BCC8DA5|nr:30S ribosomal protein S12 methylthiotransferase RimO [Chlamydiifrater phoenicopteri]
MTVDVKQFFNKELSENKIHFISLGCPRNLVDSEVMLGLLLQAGYEVCDDPRDADYFVLNTCAFLKAARDEVEEHLDKLVKVKKPTAKIILTGCMVSKHKEALKPWFPHIHYMLGSGNVESILEAISSKERGEKIDAKSYLEAGEVPRKLSTPKHYAYLKIAEGCRKQCSFCIIPSIKGKLRSKPLDRVLKEFRILLSQGVKEIILIAQDLGDYGKDISGKSMLVDLLRAILKEKGVFWIRMLYLYPDEVNDEIIALMKEDSRLLPYLDMPIQHINDRILKAMFRKTSGAEIRHTLKRLREQVPLVKIRSSIIVGFPGETEEEFCELVDFVKEGLIDNLGIFTYSQEEGSHAAKLESQISNREKSRRLSVLSKIQQKIVEKKNLSYVGKKMIAVVDGYHPDSSLLLAARFYGQAPEIDGCIVINDARKVSNLGEWYEVEITGVIGYDLVGRVVSKASYSRDPIEEKEVL